MPKYEPMLEELGSDEPQSQSTDSGDSLPDLNDHFSEDARLERMQMAMLEVMDGAVARGRSLKYWENLRLKPVHMQMLLMKAAGYRNQDIATKLDYDQGRVSVIVNHPDAQYLLSHLVSYQAEALLDVKARIQAHAGEALDTVLMVMRTAPKAETRAKVGFQVLGMAGYGAVQKQEVSHKIEMDASAASNLTNAIREASQLEDIADADWETIEAEGAGEEPEVGRVGGLGNPGVPKGASTSEPPASGLHVSTSIQRIA